MLGNHGRSITRTIFTPVARVLAKMHVTPNMVTLTGTVVTVALAVTLLARGHLTAGGIAVGIVLFCDSIDGVLARETGQTSRFGAFFDSTLDRIGDGAVFGSLLAWAVFGMDEGATRTVSIIAGIIAMCMVGTVPYARARAESVGVVAKVGIAERTDRLVIALVCAAASTWGLPQWVFAVGLVWVAFASFVTVCQRVWFTYRHIDESVTAEA